MSNPLDAAADELLAVAREMGDARFAVPTVREMVVERVLLAYFRAAVGCDCQHTDKPGFMLVEYMPTADRWEPCPKDHVELTILGGTIASNDGSAATKSSDLVAGETVWADPERCEWRCDDAGVIACGLLDADGVWICDPDSNPKEDHVHCGFVPRIDILLGNEKDTAQLDDKSTCSDLLLGGQ